MLGLRFLAAGGLGFKGFRVEVKRFQALGLKAAGSGFKVIRSCSLAKMS